MMNPADNHFFTNYGNDGQAANIDVQLAYLLQHGKTEDPYIQYLLVEHFSAKLHHLIRGWIELVHKRTATPEVTKKLTIEILTFAVSQVEMFRGEENVQRWLYRLTVRRLSKLGYIKVNHSTVNLINDEIVLKHVFHLSKQDRILLWLRYGMGLNVPDIAYILGKTVTKSRKMLQHGRRQLLSEMVASNRQKDCKHCVDNLFDQLDGLEGQDPKERLLLEEHIRQCPTCQQDVKKISDFEQAMLSEMDKIWPLPIIKEVELKAYDLEISTRPEKHPLLTLTPAWIKAAWTGLFIMIFLGSGMFWMRRSEDILQPTSAPQAEILHNIISSELPEELMFQDPADEQWIQYVSQDQSEDSNWVVYIVYEIRPMEEGNTYREQVFLYNIDTQSALQIFDSQPVTFLADNLWFAPPSIAGDGGWLTFAAPGYQTDIQEQTCLNNDGIPCLDVYVYERATGEITLISQGWNGERGNGDSFSPVISGDGMTVAFWSSATNLIAGQVEECNPEEQSESCLTGFIYSQHEQSLSPIQVIGRQVGRGYGRFALSADGNVMAYSLVTEDYFSGAENYQSYIFDRDGGRLIVLNQALDGTPGNGSTYNPVIDATGRYVAFASDSSNLVPDDTNSFTDVFWLDRNNGELVRISMGMGGEQANGDSGVLIPDSEVTSLGISADGQKVVYLSSASNLTQNPGACSHVSPELCVGLYYYDRQTGQTELITPRQSNGFSYLPDISADGRWITYSSIRFDCQTSHYCSDILRYDRMRGWTYNLMDFEGGSPEYLWRIGASLPLPNVRTNAMIFSKNGEYIAIANSDTKVRIYDLGDRSEAATLEGRNSAAIISLDFSPDGSLLAGGTVNAGGYVWDVQAGRLLYELEEIQGRVIDVFFSADGGQLIFVTEDELSIWQFGEQNLTRTQHMRMDGPRMLDTDLSPAGNLLASARQDGSVWLQFISNGLVLAQTSGGPIPLHEVIFSADGSRLASRAVDGTINLWQVSWQGFGALDVTHLASYNIPNWIGNLDIQANGSSLATLMVDGGAGIWSIEEDRTFRLPGPLTFRLAFSPHGDVLAIAGNESIELWNGPGNTGGTYFRRQDGDIVTGAEMISEMGLIELQSGSRLSSDSQGRSLYEADEQWGFDLVAPAHIPEDINFQGAYFEDEKIVLHYTVQHGIDSEAELYVLEQDGTVDPLMLMGVGHSADIYERTGNGIQVEYVQGDWQPVWDSSDTLADLDWIWNNRASAERLTWVHEDILITMYYTDRTPAARTIGLADLLQIAEGFQSVTQPPHSFSGSFDYTVQYGDTCSGIADRFHVNAQTIVAMNQLDENCDWIFAGQPLHIPITNRSYDLFEADMNCDGASERVEVSFVEQMGLWSSVRVMSIGATGLYQPVWEWRLADTSVERINRVIVLGSENCPKYLAVEVAGSYQVYWSLFSWDGSTMQPIEIDPGELERLLESSGEH